MPHLRVFGIKPFRAIVALFAVAIGYQMCPPLVTHALILSGSPDSFARYPKWAQTFENELSFEFKTRLPNALLLYTDDGTVQLNFFAISLLEGHVQVDLRLGDQQVEPVERRPLVQMGLPNTRVDDGKWHRFSFFQAWENVRVQVDGESAFRVLAQRSFSLGNIRSNSDVFVGGIPKEVERLSSPLRRHSIRFAGTIRNLVYRLYPQGVSNPQVMDSIGTRKMDEDYCGQSAANPSPAAGNCLNGGRCYSAGNGPRCDCSLSEFEGRRCEIRKPSTEVSFFGNEWLGYDLRSESSTREDQQKTSTTGMLGPDPEGAQEEEPRAVWSPREVFNITFRTNHSNALLLLAGDARSHVELFLEGGVILARSQLAGSEKRIIRVQDRALRHVHFDDNLWHSVTIVRELSSPGLKSAVFSMRLIVDDFFNQQVRQFSPAPRLGNAFLFLGGAPSALTNQLLSDHLFPFRGCFKKAFFQSGPIQLNLIALADQGFGQSSVQTFGDLSYSCASNSQVPEVFSFNDGQNFTELPAWNSPARGTLAFQFRTLVPDGLLLYHGQLFCPNFTICDYLAFELVDGHLMMVINLGSGEIRLQASAKSLNDGRWHSVVMERSGRRGFVTVDALRTDFSCPGISANLNIDDPIFLGAVPLVSPFAAQRTSPETVTVIQLTMEDGGGGKQQRAEDGGGQGAQQRYPSAVWSIGLGEGFVGCMKNIRVNGINAQIAQAFRKTMVRGGREGHGRAREAISAGCPFSFSADFCARAPRGNPCKNGGICRSVHNSFRCDCANSPYEGPTCAQKPRLVQFPLPFDQIRLAVTLLGWQSEAESIELKFRIRLSMTAGNSGDRGGGKGGEMLVLMDTRKGEEDKKDRMMMALLGGAGAAGGLLMDWVFASGEEQTLHWAYNLSSGNIADGNWHSAGVRRRGRNVGLFIDGQWTQHKLNVQHLAVGIDELAVGHSLGPHQIKNQPAHLFRFHGDLRHFTLNGNDLLKPLRSAGVGAGKRGFSSPASHSTTSKESVASQEEANTMWDSTKYDETFVSPPAPRLPVHLHQQQQQFPKDSFFTKAPLGCLRQSERHRCETEEVAAEDGFFTPVLPKPLRKATAASSSSTRTTATSTSSTTTPTRTTTSTITTTTRRSVTPLRTTTTAKTAPSFTRRPPTAQTSPTARFSVAPDDPTLYAVRPTTPMNGMGTMSTPKPISIDSSSNQLGDDKKFLIGVGSLSIVVMVGAILLCVFCKRCNSLCSQLANAAGAAGGAQVAAGAGIKAGYTPIPPNEFASPQLPAHQQHQMANFDRTAQATATPSLLRNGASLGNGMPAVGIGATAERQTRVMLANGGGTAPLRETTSLINAPTRAAQSAAEGATAQRRRDFKEWYV